MQESKGQKNETQIFQLSIPVEEIKARLFAEDNLTLEREAFSGSLASVNRIESQDNRKTDKRLKQQPISSIEIQHPVLTFIEELCGEMKNTSDQFLRPPPAIGIIRQPRAEIDFSNLLSVLEKGEKKLGLISHSKPSLDILANSSRHLAHAAEFMVRNLRKQIVTSSSDPSRPGEARAAALLEAVDALNHRLFEMKLNFEDLASQIFIQIQMQTQTDSVN